MKLNLLKTLLLTCLLGVWGADCYASDIYGFTISSATKGSDFPSNNYGTTSTGTFSYDNVVWTVVATAATDYASGPYYWSWGNSGLQMGSSNAYYSAVSITSNGFAENTGTDYAGTKITKVIVNAHAGSNATATISLSVGGTAFLCGGSTTPTLVGSGSYSDYEFVYSGDEEGATGEIEISYSQPSTHIALYFNGLDVYDADNKISPELAYSASEVICDLDTYKSVELPELTYVNGFDGVNQITYSSSDTSVATVDNSGTVTILGIEGSTTITAIFAGNDTYEAGEASYTITVDAVHTYNFEEYTYDMTVHSGNDSSYEENITSITADNGSVISFTGNYRLWNSENEGQHLRMNSSSTFTLSAPSGSTIEQIVITGTNSKTTTSDNLSSSNPSSNPTGTSYSSHVVTWTGSAESVTFTFSSTTHLYYIDVTLSAPTSGSFTITEAGYATYYTDYEYAMPEGVTGTTVTGVTKDSEDDGVAYVLTLPWEYVAGSTVPAGTALILKGEANTYEYTITSNNAAAVSSNLLMGSISETTTTGPDSSKSYVYYELSDGQYGVGFYYGAEDGAAFTSEANKAWLPLDKSTIASARFIGFGDDTTGISSVENASEKAVSGIYTLQGVRVNDMNQKGIYIVDGKKVIKR